ncbi:MAG: hypothetical protein QXS54_07700 [Candidatus Methanomethylicaceae archaeon]
MSDQGTLSQLIRKYQEFLNNDPELKRRLTPYSTFCGGPAPYPGAGPYPPPNLAMDPTGWTKANGYPKTILLGKELITFKIRNSFAFTISLNKNGTFSIEPRTGIDPILSVEMPSQLFKDMALGKERVVYSLADPQNSVSYKEGIAFSDWITIFEVISALQELVESDPELWQLIEGGL